MQGSTVPTHETRIRGLVAEGHHLDSGGGGGSGAVTIIIDALDAIQCWGCKKTTMLALSVGLMSSCALPWGVTALGPRFRMLPSKYQ